MKTCCLLMCFVWSWRTGEATVSWIAQPNSLSVRLDSFYTSSVRVSWMHHNSPSILEPVFDRHPYLIRYELSYRAINERFRIVLDIPIQARSARLDRLRPGTEYELYLSSVSSTSVHNDSKVIHFIAPGARNLTDVLDFSHKSQSKSGGVVGSGNSALVTVREEEIIIVSMVLVVWVAVIALFINKWGKIRMLEPYQPPYLEEEAIVVAPPVVGKIQRASLSEQQTTPHLEVYPMTHYGGVGVLPQAAVVSPLTYSGYFGRASRGDHLSHAPSCSGINRMVRTRQNSVFVAGTSSMGNRSFLMTRSASSASVGEGGSRKTKSAEDLKSLVVEITECDAETTDL